MKKLAVSVLAVSLLIGACQQGTPTANTTASPTATTPATPTATETATPVATATPTAPAGDLAAFAGEYTGNYSDKKKEEQKGRGLTSSSTKLALTADGNFAMLVSFTGTDPESKEEKTDELAISGTFTVEGQQMKLTAKKLVAADGKESAPTDDKPLVMTIEEGGKKLTLAPDQATDAISPDFFTKN